MLNIPANTLKAPWAKEKSNATHINILGHFDESTLIDKDGHLIKLFTLSGVDALTQSDLQNDVLKNRRNSLWKNFSSEFAVYSWTIRRKTAQYPDGEFTQPFAKALNARYRAKMEHTELFHNQLYLALVTKPPEGYLKKTLHWFKRLNAKLDKNAHLQSIKKIHEGLQQAANRLESALQTYGIKSLGVTQRNNKRYSEALEFLTEVLNTKRYAVPLLKVPASQLLSRKRLFFSNRSGIIEYRGSDNTKRYATVISIKEYDGNTFAGMMDELSKLPLEFCITQSYRFYDRHTAKTLLKNQQDDLEQTQDEAFSQSLALTEALDDAASGDTGFGIHQLTIVCTVDRLDTLNQAAADIIATLGKLDIIGAREDLLTECGFWSQLPGNFSYIPRPSPISTQNFSGFCSLHNATQGQISGNYWGDAVTVFETLSGSPYYFNFHYRDVGNTLIFGAMGAGKTVLMGFLLAQSLKFGVKAIVFDKDRGLDILVRALGGHYEILKPGTPTGFNPCLLPDAPENREFLAELFKKLLTTHSPQWDEQDSERVEKVINNLYTLPVSDRRFRHLAPFFGSRVKGSLRTRFDEWHSDGNKAWVFDNEADTLDLSSHILGFELGAILKAPDTKIPTFMYLLHRVDQALAGQRGEIFIDEGWKVMDDAYFKKEIEEWGRTPRKKNRFLCLGTQSANDAVNSSVSDVLSQSAAVTICFPNPAAKPEIYINKLGLSRREYDLIKTLDDTGRFFLLKYGKGKESVVARVDLSGLNDILDVLSGRETSVLLLDAIRAHVGNDPTVWLPLFKAIMPVLATIRHQVGHDPHTWLTYFLANRSLLCPSEN